MKQPQPGLSHYHSPCQLDNAALQSGTPKLEFVRQGLGRGPVTVTMPDGEILKGEYQLTENAASASAFLAPAQPQRSATEAAGL